MHKEAEERREKKRLRDERAAEDPKGKKGKTKGKGRGDGGCRGNSKDDKSRGKPPRDTSVSGGQPANKYRRKGEGKDVSDNRQARQSVIDTVSDPTASTRERLVANAASRDDPLRDDRDEPPMRGSVAAGVSDYWSSRQVDFRERERPEGGAPREYRGRQSRQERFAEQNWPTYGGRVSANTGVNVADDEPWATAEEWLNQDQPDEARPTSSTNRPGRWRQG